MDLAWGSLCLRSSAFRNAFASFNGLKRFRREEAMDLALGIACACAVGRSETLLQVLTVWSVLGVSGV